MAWKSEKEKRAETSWRATSSELLCQAYILTINRCPDDAEVSLKEN